MDRTKSVEHLAQVSRPALDACDRIVSIGNAEFTRGAGHELGKTDRACMAKRHGVVSRFGPDECIEQPQRQAMAVFSAEEASGFLLRLGRGEGEITGDVDDERAASALAA